jgi:long-chain-alcohol oxidase
VATWTESRLAPRRRLATALAPLALLAAYGGGGVVAGEPARAGLDVVVLEKGGYAAERDFSHQEGDAYRDLYLYAQTLTSDDLSCRIVAGSTLGGAR